VNSAWGAAELAENTWIFVCTWHIETGKDGTKKGRRSLSQSEWEVARHACKRPGGGGVERKRRHTMIIPFNSFLILSM
jgi:hypothetical protein